MRRLRAALLLAAFLLAILLPAGSNVLARQPPPGITREAKIRLLVEDTDAATAAIQRLVDRMGGIVESSESWTQVVYGMSRPFATLVVSIPNVQLENTMQGLRGMALDVLEQNIASRDTAPQVTELTARRSYLGGQRDRLEDLLEKAEDDSDRQKLDSQLYILQEELASVEEQLNTLWWAQHDARLTIHLEPFVATPIPTLRITPRPTSTPRPWDPGRTLEDTRQFWLQWYYNSPRWQYPCCAGSIILAATGIMLLLARKRKM